MRNASLLVAHAVMSMLSSLLKFVFYVIFLQIFKNNFQMHILAQQGTMTMFNKTVNFCNKNELPVQIQANVGLFGIPMHCPVKESFVFCYKREVMMKASDAQLKLVYVLTKGRPGKIMLNITHDNGNSCFEAERRFFSM